MARSMYVYMVCHRATNSPLGCFTVKYEANDWAKASRWPKDQLILFRTLDGRSNNKDSKEFKEIPFDF